MEKIAEFLGVQKNPEFLKEVVAKCDFKVQYKERTTNVEEFVAKYSRNTPNFLYRKGIKAHKFTYKSRFVGS